MSKVRTSRVFSATNDSKAKAADEKDSIAYSGRVLGPDSKPVSGAKLYWRAPATRPPRWENDFTWAKKAATNADGHFELTLRPEEISGGNQRFLVAAADGFGIDWIELPNDKSGELTLRLVHDAPIRGRILDSQGKPVAGVRVHVSSILVNGPDLLDKVLECWKRDWRDLGFFYRRGMYASLGQVLKAAPTDKDGRFTMRGVGLQRLATVEVEGPMISNAALEIVTRSGFDPKPYNDAAARVGRPGGAPLLYGPTFDFVATPSRVMEGNIRDQGIGKPVAGVRVSCSAGNSIVHTASDAEGHYKLAGLAKADKYFVSVTPPTDSNLLPRWTAVPGADGLGPIARDFDLARGVFVTGRIIDRSTGKGVRGRVRFVALPDNPFFDKKSYRQSQMRAGSDDQGNFRIVLIPGPGVLLAEALPKDLMIDGLPVHTYPAAQFDAEDAKRVKVTHRDEERSFATVGNTLEYLNQENAVKVVDFGEGTETGKCELHLDGAKTLKVRIEDPDGKPVSGAIVSGMTALWPITFPIKEAECTLYGLDGSRQRHVLIYHQERKLSGHIIVRGNESEPVTVRLAPTGTVTGRLHDLEGQPIAGIQVSLSMPLECERELFRYVNAQRAPTKTDKDGRFHLDGVPPKLMFWLDLYLGRTYYVREQKILLNQIGSGKTLDLGDVQVKPAR
jgi:protocatechuate 3,4-dioxygenase beta subunit